MWRGEVGRSEIAESVSLDRVKTGFAVIDELQRVDGGRSGVIR